MSIEPIRRGDNGNARGKCAKSVWLVPSPTRENMGKISIFGTIIGTNMSTLPDPPPENPRALALKKYDTVLKLLTSDTQIYWLRSQFFFVANATLLGFEINGFPGSDIRTSKLIVLFRWRHGNRHMSSLASRYPCRERMDGALERGVAAM